jgi:Fe-S cluster biosynthesis and repair protein YggX
MTRMVFCKKYQKELAGLALPPFPGAKGKEIYEQISAQAWQDWQKQQTMLINEKHLNLASADDRKYLQAQMDHYFANEDFDTASGYVPPEE